MKNLLLLSALFVSFSTLGLAQSEERPVRVCDNMPKLAECAQEDNVQADRCTQMTVISTVLDEVVYPESAQEAGVEGTVYVSFIIEKDGSVNEVTALRGVGDSPEALTLTEEAVRAVKLLPDFTPGLNEEGDAVRVNMVCPVRFLLSR